MPPEVEARELRRAQQGEPDVVRRLAQSVEPDQGPPMPPEIAERERRRVEEPERREIDPDTLRGLQRAMAYRGFREAGQGYVPPEGADPKAVQQAKLAILLEDGQLTPDLIRQLPEEDQRWISAQIAEHREEMQARQAADTGVIGRLAGSLGLDDDAQQPRLTKAQEAQAAVALMKQRDGRPLSREEATALRLWSEAGGEGEV